MVYHAPGNIDELSQAMLEAWNAELSSIFAGQIEFARMLIEPDAGRAWMFDPIAAGTAGVGQATIDWIAFPKRVSNSGLPPREGWRLVDDDRNRHEEYCEWEVAKDATGKVVRVTLTCETEDYYDFLFRNDQTLLLELYHRHVSPQVTISQATLMSLKDGGRSIQTAHEDDALLGPLGLLPGVWKNEGGLEGRGWNMIALPFETRPGSVLDYRLLLNQYNETLIFDLVDKGVPNRGLTAAGMQADQSLVALDYEQVTDQIATVDFPPSAVLGATVPPKNTIHHEPGLWLNLLDQITDGFDIARLGSVPHGDAVLALGRSVPTTDGPPNIPDVSGLPLKVKPDLENPYLAPFKHFHENLFEGLFDPVHPAELLKLANAGVDILRTTTLDVDTEAETGGIKNIPFIVKQANASSMRSTFWIQELAETDAQGKPKLRLQYLQVVMLDFDPRTAGLPGRIVWPHISINTMHKVQDAPRDRVRMLMSR